MNQYYSFTLHNKTCVKQLFFIKIQFKNEETAQEVCNRFANKAIINIDDFYFKYGEKVLDLDFPLLSQLNLKEETKEIEILVLDIGQSKRKKKILMCN